MFFILTIVQPGFKEPWVDHLSYKLYRVTIQIVSNLPYIYTKTHPLFRCQREVGNNVNGHPVLLAGEIPDPFNVSNPYMRLARFYDHFFSDKPWAL